MNYMTVKRNNRNIDLWKDFDNVFESFFNSSSEWKESRTPVTRVTESDTGFTLTAELPGFSAEELNVHIEENILKIQAQHKQDKKEKKKGSLREEHQELRFEKTFVLPQDIAKDKIEADLKNGLLTMTIPKQPKPAPISIKVQG